MILNLTLEIIYLLTGEDYGPVKMPPGYHESAGARPCSPGRWSRTQRPNTHSSLTTESSKKILGVTNKISELLTREVRDVGVFVSMEEQTSLRPGDIYKEATMEVEQTSSITDEHIKSENRDGGHVNSALPQNEVSHNGSSESSPPESFQKVGEVVAPTKPCLGVFSHDHNEQRASNLIPATDQATSCNRGCCYTMKYGTTEPKEEPSLLDNSIHEAQEPSTVDRCEEPSVVLSKENNMEGPHHIKLELQHDEGLDVTAICKITETVKTLNFKTGDDAVTPLDQEDVDTKEGVPADSSDCPKPVLVPSQTSCNGEDALCFSDQSQFELHETTEQNQFECSECGECFARNSQLVEHHRLHSIEKPFACPECGKQFDDRAKVVAHQLIHNTPAEATNENPTGEGLVLCSECGMGFTNEPALEDHQKVHKQEKIFVCLVCGKSFSRRGHLSNHSRIHTGGKRIPEGKYFPHGSYIRKRSFLCPECGKWFPSRSHLDRHQRVHTGEKPFSCTECDKRFTDRSGLVIHQRIHTGEKPYSCDDCGKRFRDRSGLVVHQRNHTGAHPFKCLQCGKCFHNRPRLERHMNVHGKKKDFSCPDCEQCFTSASTLTLHRQTHFSQLPTHLESTRLSPPPVSQSTPKSFCCSECGKSFADLSTLSLHVKTHKIGDRQVKGSAVTTRLEAQQRILKTEPSLRLRQSQLDLQRTGKPYSCSQCDQTFCDRTSLLAHEEKHSEEKPYKCSKCGEGFVLKGYLTKHLQTHG